MRVLLLGLHRPDRSPAQRYRIEQFLPYLESHGVEVDYRWLLDENDLAVFYGQRPLQRKAWLGLRTSAQRLLDCALPVVRKGYDLILVQREAHFLGSSLFECLASLGAPLVIDFDDAIWLETVSEGNRSLRWLKNPRKFERSFSRADRVLAGNDYLAAYARRYARRVSVVPTVVDTDRYVPWPNRRPGPIRIGWSGSFSTLKHFEIALPALERLKKHCGDAISIHVMGVEGYRRPELGLVSTRWTPQDEVHALQTYDLGIMPLPDDEWSKGKCALKALLYMAVGAVPVVSAVGVNGEVVGSAGVVVERPEDFYEALLRLVERPAERQALATAARERVVRAYSVTAWAPTVHELLVETALRSRSARARASRAR